MPPLPAEHAVFENVFGEVVVGNGWRPGWVARHAGRSDHRREPDLGALTSALLVPNVAAQEPAVERAQVACQEKPFAIAAKRSSSLPNWDTVRQASRSDPARNRARTSASERQGAGLRAAPSLRPTTTPTLEPVLTWGQEAPGDGPASTSARPASARSPPPGHQTVRRTSPLLQAGELDQFRRRCRRFRLDLELGRARHRR